MSNTTTTSTSSIGGLGFVLLTITFVVLKALGYINWSWWLVFLPLYGPIVLFLALAALFFAVVAVIQLLQNRRAAKARRDRFGR